jgi:hypothetical protein
VCLWGGLDQTAFQEGPSDSLTATTKVQFVEVEAVSANLFLCWAHAKRALLDYVKLPGYLAAAPLAAPLGQQIASFFRRGWHKGSERVRQDFRTEEAFWKVVHERSESPLRPGAPICLNGFFLSSWVPRVSGLYFRAGSDELRLRSESNILRYEGELVVYTPFGKSRRILGGIGTVRFRPSLEARLIGATSSGWASCGVPVLVRGQALKRLDEDVDWLQATLSGRWCSMPREFACDLGDTSDYPRSCLVVEDRRDIEVLGRRDRNVPLRGAYWKLFECREQDTALPWAHFAYSEFDIADPANLKEASEWVGDYQREQHGRAITDCDEQQPAEDAELPLIDLMAGGLGNRVRQVVRRVQRMVEDTKGDFKVRLSRALVDHFDQGELEMMVRRYLDIPLERIVGRTLGTADQVDSLVDYCDQQDRLLDLVAALKECRPAAAWSLSGSG